MPINAGTFNRVAQAKRLGEQLKVTRNRIRKFSEHIARTLYFVFGGGFVQCNPKKFNMTFKKGFCKNDFFCLFIR